MKKNLLKYIKKLSEIMEVSVFIPAHITGFFTICNNEDSLKKGSCGGGLLIDKGVTTRIKIQKNALDNKRIDIKINGKKDKKNETIILKTLEIMEKEFPLKEYFEKILKNKNLSKNNIFKSEDYYISIENEIEVPIGAGFGISASSALGIAIGIGKLLNLPASQTELAKFAHLAEISLGSGLGDVIGQNSKGMVIRLSPGAPGIGKTTNLKKTIIDGKTIDLNNIYVLTKTFGEIETSNIIKNKKFIKNINHVGANIQKKIIDDLSLENFMKLSFEFAKKTNLMNEKVSNLVDELNETTIGSSMAMLGNTVFALVLEEDLNTIKNLDDFIISKISTEGLKIIEKDEMNSK
jgi:pantoate kinase